MTLNLSLPGQEELKPRITVFGVGGAGGNAVNNMIEKSLEGADFVVANTDAQALQQNTATNKIQIGIKVTEGLGAGARAEVGAAAAEESIEQIVDHLAGSHMCFITAGMGGGTGTGAAPIIAQAARELGVLTVGVVTKPFQFEGTKRMRQAEAGVEALQKVVDTLIIIPNQNLFRLANERTTFAEAFSLADDVLYQGVKGVTDLMVRPGLINLDFADVRAVMDEMGKAMMGTGEAEGEDRAIQAAEQAIANPLLDEISLRGAKGVLINITGGYDLTLFELDEAANRIREEVDAEANIIVGSTLDPDVEGTMRVSVVATGIDANEMVQETPVARRSLAEPLQPKPEERVQPAAIAAETAPVQAPAAVAEQPNEEEVQNANFFDRLAQEEAAAAAEQAEDIFQDEQVAYQQQPVAQTPGTPSPETMERLYRAVNKVPSQQAASAPSPSAQVQPFERAEQPDRRFGINSLINRMAGQSAQEKPAEFQRRQPPVNQFDEDVDNYPQEDDRVEIPAFLRRQAN
ncbi:MAG: cell division protein FtsZ [Paracoccaceae bacterium]|nr:cell division protein FtsZ [Paracoccaceae bacterium]MDG2257258.1 cell division protein FtsZ [Paracoccaceae bacterium]